MEKSLKDITVGVMWLYYYDVGVEKPSELLWSWKGHHDHFVALTTTVESNLYTVCYYNNTEGCKEDEAYWGDLSSNNLRTEKACIEHLLWEIQEALIVTNNVIMLGIVWWVDVWHCQKKYFYSEDDR